MIKLFGCTEKVMKQKVDSEIKQSPFVFWGGWIGAKRASKKSIGTLCDCNLVDIFYYKNFPKKTWDLHLYLREIPLKKTTKRVDRPKEPKQQLKKLKKLKYAGYWGIREGY